MKQLLKQLLIIMTTKFQPILWRKSDIERAHKCTITLLIDHPQSAN